MNLIFTYGSLKNGFSNHSLIENEKFIGIGKTVQLFSMFRTPFANYPATVKEERSRIHGEVYEVSDKCLKELDILEGHPNLYKRELTEIELKDNKIIKCYLYFYLFDDHVGEAMEIWETF